MSDTVTYVKNQDGSFTKTVTHIVTPDLLPNEISANQQMLQDLMQGLSGIKDAAAKADVQAQVTNITNNLITLNN